VRQLELGGRLGGRWLHYYSVHCAYYMCFSLFWCAAGCAQALSDGLTLPTTRMVEMRVCFARDGANPCPGSYNACLTIPILVQNGRWLTPDHGFPVRVVVPGNISGRMVKWLTEVRVDDKESQNHYHFFDNRLLPSHVDQGVATKEGR
jgi:DMSO/TMAO reductase YedYZ molybdopterin-dependent catalytic subunit